MVSDERFDRCKALAERLRAVLGEADACEGIAALGLVMHQYMAQLPEPLRDDFLPRWLDVLRSEPFVIWRLALH